MDILCFETAAFREFLHDTAFSFLIIKIRRSKTCQIFLLQFRKSYSTINNRDNNMETMMIKVCKTLNNLILHDGLYTSAYIVGFIKRDWKLLYSHVFLKTVIVIRKSIQICWTLVVIMLKSNYRGLMPRDYRHYFWTVLYYILFHHTC